MTDKLTKHYWTSLLGALCIWLSCSAEPQACGNAAEIWFYAVLEEQDCDSCREIPWSSPNLDVDTFRVHDLADVRLARCSVIEVQVAVDAVTLLLSPQAYRPLADFRERLAKASGDPLVLIRVEDSEAPLAVVHAEDLRISLTIFDIGSRDQIDSFVNDLGPDADAVSRSATRLLPDGTPESPATQKATQLLRELENTEPIFDELQAALESRADEAEVGRLIEAVERESARE